MCRRGGGAEGMRWQRARARHGERWWRLLRSLRGWEPPPPLSFPTGGRNGEGGRAVPALWAAWDVGNYDDLAGRPGLWRGGAAKGFAFSRTQPRASGRAAGCCGDGVREAKAGLGAGRGCKGFAFSRTQPRATGRASGCCGDGVWEAKAGLGAGRGCKGFAFSRTQPRASSFELRVSCDPQDCCSPLTDLPLTFYRTKLLPAGLRPPWRDRARVRGCAPGAGRARRRRAW
jgi:hypothetical protein